MKLSKRSLRMLALVSAGLLTVGVATAAETPPTPEARPSEAILELRRRFIDAPLNALTFHTIDSIFNTQPVLAGRTSRPLPRADAPLAFSYAYKGETISAEDGLERTYTNALLIIKDGKVVVERYRNLTRPDTKFLSMSMAKSFTSLLLGAALRDGAIRSLDDQVTVYVPELKGSAYDGVTVRNLVDMKTGVDRNDGDQLKPGTPGAAMREQIFVRNARPAADEALLVKRKAQPGAAFEYSTLNSTVLGWVIERATGQPLARYTSDKLWKPLGAEADAFWMVDGVTPKARPMTGVGFNATLRDYGRVGLMMLQGGRFNGVQVLPASWIAESTGEPHAPIAAGASRGYQHAWWTVANSPAYMADGLGGQFIYVDPATRTVVVKLSYVPGSNRQASEEANALIRAASAWTPR